MDTTTRKSLLILLGILILEAVPFSFVLRLSSGAGVSRLYAFRLDQWPAWAAAGAITFAYVAYACRALPLVRQRFLDLHWLKLLAIPFAIVTGTMEELWFRRMLMDWCAGRGASIGAQVAASAIIFGAAHGIWGLFGRQWRVAAGAAAATGVLGALLGMVYLVSARDVAPCIWSHMLINLAIEPWLILAAVSAGGEGWRREGR